MLFIIQLGDKLAKMSDHDHGDACEGKEVTLEELVFGNRIVSLISMRRFIIFAISIDNPLCRFSKICSNFAPGKSCPPAD